MLHTAAEGKTATKDNTEGGEGTGDGGEGVILRGPLGVPAISSTANARY